MANETHRTDKAGATKPMPQAPDFVGMWDAAAKTQRQWLGACTQPFGVALTPEKMWKRWQMFNTECLDQTERSFMLMKDFVSDEVRFARELADKTVEMTKGRDKDASATVVEPELTREWLDTARRSVERTIKFNTESMKAAEEFGLKVSDMLMKEPIAKAN